MCILNFQEFFYLVEKGMGATIMLYCNACICREQYSRTELWILMKLGRNEVLMVTYKCCCFLWDQPWWQSRAGRKYVADGTFWQNSSLKCLTSHILYHTVFLYTPWPIFHAWVTMVRKKWLSLYYSTYWCYIHQTCIDCVSPTWSTDAT